MKRLSKIALAASIVAFIGINEMSGQNIPSAVKSKFASAYPQAQKVKWGKEEAYYEAEFINNNTETSVLYDSTGNVAETEILIKSTALPAPALQYIKENLSGAKITEASVITDAKGVISYEAEINKTDYLFDKNGTFIRTINEKDAD